MSDTDSTGIGCLVQIVILIFIAVAYVIYGCFLLTSTESIKGTITDTFIDGGYTYFVFLEEGKETPEVLKNSDSLWFVKWNSADYVPQLKPNNQYILRVAGWRIPRLSWFRNIIEFELIE